MWWFWASLCIAILVVIGVVVLTRKE